ncbi:MAG: DivIVA domain-containing protein [Chitinispirillaceae bacterium]
MRITPLDIRKQPFPRAFRGFDPDAVNSFLEMVAGEYEVIIHQNSEFATQIKSLEQKLEAYTKIERVLNETLLSAQKATDEARVNAQKEAELIIKDAMIRADRYENEARHRVNQLESELISLRNQRDSFLARFKAMLSTQLNLVEVISGELRSNRDEQSLSDLADDSEDDTLDEVPPQPNILG